jgi:D-alanyl-D-alanine carboxypeptidase
LFVTAPTDSGPSTLEVAAQGGVAPVLLGGREVSAVSDVQKTVPRSIGLVAAAVLASVTALSGCGGTTAGGASSQPASTGPSVSSPSASSATLWVAPGTGVLPKKTAATLQKALDTWVAAGHLVGVTAAVVTAAGTWSGAAGVDGAGTRLTPTSAMWIASTTKTFTAAEVMLLSSRGLVDLDKPLTDYIDVPFDTKGATVRQVLAMRSGFPNPSSPSDSQDLAADLTKEWTVAETLPQGVSGSTPGGAPEYNSVNYRLLGELITKFTGKTLAQALRADLLDPAGLHRTWVQTAETPAAPLTVGTNPSGAKLVDAAGPYLPSRSVASATSAAGCMAGDAADLARWGYLLYGGHVIDSALVKQMEADPQEEPMMGQYALGTALTSDDFGTVMVGHSGGGMDWPYSAVMMASTGNPAVSVAVLTPQPADFPTDIYDLFMQLQNTMTG